MSDEYTPWRDELIDGYRAMRARELRGMLSDSVQAVDDTLDVELQHQRMRSAERHGVIIDNIGLNGVLLPKGENERQIFITADAWVPESCTRPPGSIS